MVSTRERQDRATGTVATGEVLLKVRDLRTSFFTMDGVVRAVDGVDLTVRAGETYCIVGESGSGKSMAALSVLGLLPKPQGRIVGGTVEFEGRDLVTMPDRELRAIRGNRIAMIFQEPMTSLNPVFTIERQLTEAIRAHRNVSRKEAIDLAADLLNKVHIPSPRQRLKEYPHRMSGGMRQRVMIAMAMACEPRLLIADEPTTALDVTIQAQILDLIEELKAETGVAVLMITHNFGLVAETAQRTAVMYAGRIVEDAPTKDLFRAPTHPYTRGLLKAMPRLGSKSAATRGKLPEIPGIVPKLTGDLRGCAFAPRCPHATQTCWSDAPLPIEVAPGHLVRCRPDLIASEYPQ
ncbi:ABC transporter ATP-binding protein [Maritimibacter alkaliphilus]|nr:ABC transporter ATP-binding protein [Maritimibacter alkaliphilus]